MNYAEYYDKNYKKKGCEHWKNKSGFYDGIWKLVKKKKGRILDIGCGCGGIIDKAVNVMGVDCSKVAIAYAQERLPNILRVGDVTNLECMDEYFDCVIMLELIEHLEDKDVDKALSEAMRVLKKGGQFILTTPNKEMRRQKIDYVIPAPEMPSEHIREYNSGELSKVVSKYVKVESCKPNYSLRNFYKLEIHWPFYIIVLEGTKE